MISQVLLDARKYEEAYDKKITADQRPAFHLPARVGWMNDPNGFSYYKGEYHLFYQYYPYDTKWGTMHWAHAVSRDLLHWTCLPAALAPDSSSDRDGCFSGSGIELPDGRHLLMYTGVLRESQKDGSTRDIQTQCLAVGDGIDYEKYSENPVLTGDDLPEGASRFDFRDPKLWQEKDGTYRCVIGNRPADGSGQILMFKSPDGFDWKFDQVLIENKDRLGKMWECPDFFELDGKQVLLISPQDMLPQGFEYHNGNATICIIGHMSEDGKFVEEANQAVDYGIDFYAAQTVETEDGRRVMVGWMQNWDTCSIRADEGKWFGQVSLPRELSIKDGRLIQTPIRELENLRGEKVTYENLTVDGALKLSGVTGRKVDMEVEIEPEDVNDIYHKFSIHIAENDAYHTSVSFRPYESILKIDRKFSGSRRANIHQRRCKVRSQQGKLKLRIILDRFSAEIFANDGEHVMTMTLYTEQSAEGISFLSDGKVRMNLVKYSLES